MAQTRYLNCTLPDCLYCKEGICTKSPPVALQGRQCADYEERPEVPDATVTIEVKDGVVLNVYASPDLPEIDIQLIDFDNLRDAPESEVAWAERMLESVAEQHKHIF